MSKRGLSILILLAIGLTACSKKDDAGISFDGQYFKAKTKKNGDDLADFTTIVGPVSASLDGALAAGGYEGTKYCIENFGTSIIIWGVGPETDHAQLAILDDTITLQGRCDP